MSFLLFLFGFSYTTRTSFFRPNVVALGSFERVQHIAMYVMEWIQPFPKGKQQHRIFCCTNNELTNERTRSVQLILDIFLNYSPELHFRILLGRTIYWCTVALQQLYYYLYSGRALHNNWGGKKDPRAEIPTTAHNGWVMKFCWYVQIISEDNSITFPPGTLHWLLIPPANTISE